MRLVVVFAVACASAPAGAPQRPSDRAQASAAPAGERRPSEPECDALFRHAIDVVKTPGATASDLDATFLAMHQRFVAGCLALSRATYTCATAAGTLDDLLSCDQTTRSSSTSKSSVAPGGMTPPAPRSP